MTVRRHALVAWLLLAAGAMGACSTDDAVRSADEASQPGPTQPSSTQPSPTLPTAGPTPGSLPDFPDQDYTFTVRTNCFCGYSRRIHRVTVSGGEVTAVDPAPEFDPHEWPTIQDIIDRANEPGLAQVDVVWPAGQAWPDNVYIDRDVNMMDEEIRWVILEVQSL